MDTTDNAHEASLGIADVQPSGRQRRKVKKLVRWSKWWPKARKKIRETLGIGK